MKDESLLLVIQEASMNKTWRNVFFVCSNHIWKNTDRAMNFWQSFWIRWYSTFFMVIIEFPNGQYLNEKKFCTTFFLIGHNFNLQWLHYYIVWYHNITKIQQKIRYVGNKNFVHHFRQWFFDFEDFDGCAWYQNPVCASAKLSHLDLPI